MPHPFNRSRLSMPQAAPRIVPEPTSPIESSDLNGQPTAMMSHMSQSFKRRFSQRSPISPATASATSPPAKVDSTVLSPLSKNSLFGSYVSGSKEAQPEEDGKVLVSMSGVSESTPAKYASTPVRLMASTPDLKTPKRPISTAVYGTPPLKMANRSARAKLFTTPTKDASSMVVEKQKAAISALDSDDEFLSFLPQSLLQSVSHCQ